MGQFAEQPMEKTRTKNHLPIEGCGKQRARPPHPMHYSCACRRPYSEERLTGVHSVQRLAQCSPDLKQTLSWVKKAIRQTFTTGGKKNACWGWSRCLLFLECSFPFFLLWHAIQRLISVQSAHCLSSLLWEYSWQISNSEKVSISNGKTRPRFLTNATAFCLTDISAKESKYYKIPQLERNNDRNLLGITSQLCCGSAWSWGSPTSAHRGPEAPPPAPDVGTHHALCQRLPINIRNHFATTSFSLISKGKYSMFLRFGVKIHLYQILGSVVHCPEVRDTAVHHPAFRTQDTDLSLYCYRRGCFIGLFLL